MGFIRRLPVLTSVAQTEATIETKIMSTALPMAQLQQQKQQQQQPKQQKQQHWQ